MKDVSEQVDNIDKLQADYNNLLARYRALKIRHNNLVENISHEKSKFSSFTGSELNSIALALEGFNKDYKGIISESDYKRLMEEIRKEEEIQKKKRLEFFRVFING